MFMDNAHRPIPEYTTFTRKLEKYKWYKPLLTLILALVFYFIFAILVFFIAMLAGKLCGEDVGNFMGSLKKGYDGINIYTVTGAITTLGNVAVFVPAIMLANKITKERPLATYHSSRGGWNWKIFFKTLLIALTICGLTQIILAIAMGGLETFQNRFSVLSFLLFVVLVPFQCIAEEYFFRSFLQQTLGGWTRIPAVAILIPAVAFALLHPYNIVGKLSILISGLCFGLIAWYSAGLESSSSLHIANNFWAMLLSGLNMSPIQTETSLTDFFAGLFTHAVFIVILVLLNRKYHWLDRPNKA